MTRRIKAVVLLPGQSSELVRQLDRDELDCELVSCASETEVMEKIRTATILVSTPVSASTISAGAELRWIQSLAAGIEGWLNSVPPTIPITRMTGVYERYMAEYVFAHLLFDSQKLEELAHAQAHRTWERMNQYGPLAAKYTRSLAGLTLGVAGLGHVGTAVARLAKAFGMHVIGLRRSSNRPSSGGEVADSYFGRSELDEFLAGLDVLVLTLPATPETNGMFGIREFRLLPRGATVMNIGRGQAIDEVGLLTALREGQVGRAVIDTFRQEPLPMDSPMWDAPNITVTPHMAGAVYAHELARVVALNIRSFLRGQIPDPIVDRSLGY